MTTKWAKPFRVLDNDLYWVVSLGETRGACGYVEFEDVIPPDNYGGAESALGVLGYSSLYHCYGVQLTLGRRSAAPTAERRSQSLPAGERLFSAAGSAQAADPTNRKISSGVIREHSPTAACCCSTSSKTQPGRESLGRRSTVLKPETLG
jgi:hypothetical protein